MKLAILVIVVVLRAAHADPAATAEAEALFREGRELVAKGEYARACAAFDSSQRREPSVATMLNQSDCREKNGQLATAWSLFLEAERTSRGATDDELRKLHDVAAAHAAELEPRVSKLTIAVGARAEGLAIRRGEEVVDPLAWNHPLPIDGGTYAITASAPGRVTWTGTAEIPTEGGAITIAVPELVLAPVVVPPSPPPPPPLPPRSHVPYLLGGGSLVLLGGALAFDLWGDRTYAAAKAEVDNARQAQLAGDANRERYVAEGLLAAGVGLATYAVYLYMHDHREPLVAPVVGPRSAGIAVRF